MANRVRTLLSVAGLALLLAACGGSDDDASNGTPMVPTSSLVTAVVTAESVQTAVLDGETFVSDRILPPGALSADRLEDAGMATTAEGDEVQMARATSDDVAGWEAVSPGPDGWVVWRPEVILDVLEDAGAGASLVSVEAVEWPDACLGAPEPDEACAQVITPGYLVRLNGAGESIEYHASRAGRYRRVAANDG